MRGLMTLPWITPVRRTASSDRLEPTLVQRTVAAAKIAVHLEYGVRK